MNREDVMITSPTTAKKMLPNASFGVECDLLCYPEASTTAKSSARWDKTQNVYSRVCKECQNLEKFYGCKIC